MRENLQPADCNLLDLQHLFSHLALRRVVLVVGLGFTSCQQYNTPGSNYYCTTTVLTLYSETTAADEAITNNLSIDYERLRVLHAAAGCTAVHSTSVVS